MLFSVEILLMKIPNSSTWLFHSSHYFLLPVALRETSSISNIAHVLSGVSNVIDFNSKKEKETKNTIKVDLCFILGGTQQCHF